MNDHWTLDLSGINFELSDGIYDVIAIAEDLAGNTIGDSSLDELEIDSVPPLVPTVTINLTSDTLPTIIGTAADTNLQLSITVDGVGTWTTDQSNSPITYAAPQLGWTLALRH